jgi:hypothetical protein
VKSGGTTVKVTHSVREHFEHSDQKS